MSVKEKITGFKQSKWLAVRLIYGTLSVLRSMVRFATDGKYRAGLFAQKRYSDNYHQRSVYTYANRYPLLFEACKRYLVAKRQPRVLSFGCATGEEVFTLGEYLPDAMITGVDINEWCISECNKKKDDGRFVFVHRYSQIFEREGNFDAIFCMAVFQQTENRMNDDNSVSAGLTFKQFEKEIMMLDEKLSAGGLLVIDHSDFSFVDTACSRYYTPLDFEGNKMHRKRPQYGRDNMKVSDTQDNYRVFIKNV